MSFKLRFLKAKVRNKQEVQTDAKQNIIARELR